MINQFFFEQIDKQKLLDAKKELECIKACEAQPDVKIKNLLHLLRTVVSVLKKQSLNTDCKIASWLFMADVYGTISYIHSFKSPKSQKHSEVALNEAFSCIDKVRDITRKLPEGHVLDIEFIKKCNTFDVADVDGAMQHIADELLPHLVKESEEPLFSFVGVGI
jgi:hypothetical protein